jgi:hypothetical protein
VTQETTDQDLQVLRGLEIVSIGGLVVAKPLETGNCYGPCPADIAACNALNADRAKRLDNIAKAF